MPLLFPVPIDADMALLLLPLEPAAPFLLCIDEAPPLLLFGLFKPDGEPKDEERLPELCVR